MVMPTIDQNKAGEHPQGSAPFASRSHLAACSLVPRAIKMGSPLNTGAACVYLLLNKTILKTQQLFKHQKQRKRGARELMVARVARLATTPDTITH